MNLFFNSKGTEGYKSSSQVARILTETWVVDNMFCPRCGNTQIKDFEKNRPVADFFCPKCDNEYELKSKKEKFGNKVNDGAYDTMIKRITSSTNPDFLFMTYSLEIQSVTNLILIPKYFFVPDIIEKRKPLTQTSKRAGWTGCNILINEIPIQGKIPIILNSRTLDINEVVRRTNRAKSLEKNNIELRGWLMDILSCINRIPDSEFNLRDIYFFEKMLSFKYPNNNNIKAKIRQQLQFLRDKGYVEFLGRGKYRKIL